MLGVLANFIMNFHKLRWGEVKSCPLLLHLCCCCNGKSHLHLDYSMIPLWDVGLWNWQLITIAIVCLTEMPKVGFALDRNTKKLKVKCCTQVHRKKSEESNLNRNQNKKHEKYCSSSCLKNLEEGREACFLYALFWHQFSFW